MKYMPLATTLVLTLITISTLTVTPASTVADDRTSQRIIVDTSQGAINLHSLHDNGAVVHLETESMMLQSVLHPQTPFSIPSLESIIVSPSGTKIAFTAYTDDGTEQGRLFVYSIFNNTIEYVDIPGLGQPQWSGDGTSVLVTPILGPFEVQNRISDIFVYDITNQALRQITNTPDVFERDVVSIPPQNTIVFRDTSVDLCTENATCVAYVNNLYAVEDDGTNLRQLTDLGSETLPGLEVGEVGLCLPQSLVWSSVQQRLYFVASCNDNWIELLFSTDLSGNMRFEENFNMRFPDEIPPYRIIKILENPVTSDINVVTASLEIDSERPGTTGFIRVFRQDGQSYNLQVEAQYAIGDQIAGISFNPDGQLLAMSIVWYGVGIKSSSISVWDENTGEQIATLLSDQLVYSLSWVDVDKIQFSQSSSGIGFVDSVWEWNITTDTTRELISGELIELQAR